ncbi:MULTISPECIES: hypothetical protein [unclassified Acinetobacter]|uniref:hypothetical protein n=1 Tax=unclassified Acinetobacter TaxID=196816 RepID=UPI00211DEE2A|nr:MULTISPECIES: hypothetical protein [unclassified Acinetobacter]
MSLSKKIVSLFRPWLRSRFKRYGHKYSTNKDILINVPVSLNVLLIGIYLTDYANQAAILKKQFSSSKFHNVEQKWFAIGENPIPVEMQDVTIGHSSTKIPKFELLTNLLNNIDYQKYDYLIISDDDIHILADFIDLYLLYVEKFALKIAQPARTFYSFHDHKICLAQKNVTCRATNFVEIGPIFSIHRTVYGDILPFPVESPMGYGLDFIWPKIAEKKYFRIGIVDATPVDHSYRPQGKTYSANLNTIQMNEMLSKYENNKDVEKKALYYF